VDRVCERRQQCACGGVEDQELPMYHGRVY
jgi:hypothetical protein